MKITVEISMEELIDAVLPKFTPEALTSLIEEICANAELDGMCQALHKEKYLKCPVDLVESVYARYKELFGRYPNGGAFDLSNNPVKYQYLYI